MRASKGQAFFLLLVLLALVWAVVKAQNPGGASIPFFLVFLFLTLLNYYFGFVDKSWNPFRFLAQAATFVFLLLAILMAHLFRMEEDAVDQIAKYIDVYPVVTDVHFVPRVSKSELQHWMVKTSDPVAAVKQFYENKSHFRDWQVKTSTPSIVLVKDNFQLTIIIGKQPREDITNIFYRLESLE